VNCRAATPATVVRSGRPRRRPWSRLWRTVALCTRAPTRPRSSKTPPAPRCTSSTRAARSLTSETVDTDTTSALKKSLGIDIDPETFRLALTHRSFAFEAGGIPTNERLEFLGDSVLGLVATESLFYDNPDLPEGQLAKMRSAVVNTRALASIARRHGIG